MGEDGSWVLALAAASRVARTQSDFDTFALSAAASISTISIAPLEKKRGFLVISNVLPWSGALPTIRWASHAFDFRCVLSIS